MGGTLRKNYVMHPSLWASSLVAFSRFTLAVQNIYEHGVVDMSVVSDIALDVEVQRGLAGRAPSELNLELQKKYQADFMARSAAIDQNLANLRKVSLDPEQKRLLSELQAASAAFRAEAEHVFTFAGRFAQDEAVKVLQGRFAAADAQVRHVLDQLVDEHERSGESGCAKHRHIRTTHENHTACHRRWARRGDHFSNLGHCQIDHHDPRHEYHGSDHDDGATC